MTTNNIMALVHAYGNYRYLKDEEKAQLYLRAVRKAVTDMVGGKTSNSALIHRDGGEWPDEEVEDVKTEETEAQRVASALPD